jgi:uncharacterized membrane protein YfcA
MIYLAIGLGAGILSGLFGIGGGIVIVPALIFFASMSATRATATSLTALLLPVGALGVWQYYRSGHVDLRAGLLIAGGLFLGAFLGATIGVKLPARDLQRAFAILLLLVAGRLWFTS